MFFINERDMNLYETNLYNTDNLALMSGEKSCSPIWNSKDFFNKVKPNPTNKKRKNNNVQKKIRGVLLYTDEDKNLKTYINQYYQEFHRLSGDWCNIFILEKPSNGWIENNLSLIKKLPI